LYTQIVAEVDAGRPVGAGFYGTYFGGPHQVPVLGYVRMSNIWDSLLYIHRNQDNPRSEYLNYLATSIGLGDRDMVTIVPGGVPMDAYHRAGIGTNAATAAPLDPADQYGFRQTHGFTSTSDVVWIVFTNLRAFCTRWTPATRHQRRHAADAAGGGWTNCAGAGEHATDVALLDDRHELSGCHARRRGGGWGVGLANFDVEVDYTNIQPWLVVTSPGGGAWPAVGTNTDYNKWRGHRGKCDQ